MNETLPDITPDLVETNPAAMEEYNELLIAQFRANDGRVTGQLAGAPVLLLTTHGARSCRSRTTRLGYVRDGEAYVVAASKAGARTHPAWYHNLVACPTATVEAGPDSFRVLAREVEGEERDRLFEVLAACWPMQLDYRRKTTRRIPLLVLERQ